MYNVTRVWSHFRYWTARECDCARCAHALVHVRRRILLLLVTRTIKPNLGVLQLTRPFLQKLFDDSIDCPELPSQLNFKIPGFQ